MARKKQQLINYHTGSLTSMPLSSDVQLGELVVRHATDKPELLIKKDNNEFATFVDSGKVQSMITTSSTDLQGKIDAISNNLRDNYATSASTEAAISAVDTKLTRDYATSASTVAAISAVDKKFGSYATSANTVAAIKVVKDSVDALKNTLTNDYATSASTEAAISAVDTKLTRDYATSASTVAAIKAVDTKLTNNYADSASTVAAIKVVKDSADAIGARVTTLEGFTATTNSNVSVVKNGVSLDFDFLNMIIDCGEF